MGPGDFATEKDVRRARELGALIARQGWIVLCGGRDTGVMDAVCRGAKSAGGLTIGILSSGTRRHLSASVDIPILTGMGNARNAINVLSSDIVVACGMGAGTASEVALALKAKKRVILLSDDETSRAFFKMLDGKNVFMAETVQKAVDLLRRLLISHDA